MAVDHHGAGLARNCRRRCAHACAADRRSGRRRNDGAAVARDDARHPATRARRFLELQGLFKIRSSVMNVHDRDIVTPKVTTGAIAGSRKIYATPDTAPDLRVPVREIVMTEAAREPP